MKVIQEIKYLRSYYYHWDDTSVGGLKVALSTNKINQSNINIYNNAYQCRNIDY
jgi:hypothetical protein